MHCVAAGQSKGVIGECGMRGGYLELTNLHPDTGDEVYKSLSVNLCSNLPGQVMVDLMVNEPKEGDPSYPLYREEFDGIFSSLTRRAKTLVDGLNALEGVTCNPSDGAMYAFPQLRMPAKFVADCEASGVPADTKVSTAACTRLFPLRCVPHTAVCSTAWSCSTRRGSAWCRAPASGRRTARGTSGPPSCRRRTRSRR